MLSVFYIPDGHRRHSDITGCSIAESYRLGNTVLIEQVIEPLLNSEHVSTVGIFLLSNLNIEKRDTTDLQILLDDGQQYLKDLIARFEKTTSIQTYGDYLPKNIKIDVDNAKQLNLFIGTKCADSVGCDEVDVFIRSGGELRLSGAPKEIVGDYTQFYGIDVLHTVLKYSHIADVLDSYRLRYRRTGEE